MVLNNSANDDQNITSKWTQIAKTNDPYNVAGYNVEVNGEDKNIVVAIYLDNCANDFISLFIIKSLFEKLEDYYDGIIKDMCEKYPELVKPLEYLRSSDISTVEFTDLV